MASILWLWAQRTLWRQWRWYSGQGDACWGWGDVGERSANNKADQPIENHIQACP